MPTVPANIDMNWIAQRLLTIQRELQDVRDEITVLTGMSVRLEGGVAGLTDEVRGVRSKVNHLIERIRTLEDARTP